MRSLYRLQRQLRKAAQWTGLINVVVDTVQEKDPGRLGRYLANRAIGRAIARVTDPLTRRLFLRKRK